MKKVSGLVELLSSMDFNNLHRFEYCVYCGCQLTGFGDVPVGTVQFLGQVCKLRSHQSCWKKYGLGEDYNGSSDT